MVTEIKIKYNPLALIGFVLSLTGIFSILGIILCSISLKEIKRKKYKGKTLAIVGIILGGIFFVVYLLINPIEVEPISEEELNERIRGDIETSLFLDGYSNEEIVVINLTNNTFKEDIKQCIGNKSHVAVINLDISNKLNGIISGAVSNEYGWSLDGVYTTLNRIYNHMADPENSANLGIVMIQVYKIPEPTLDQFGNSITHDKVQLGTFILCSTIEEQINWEGMDWKRIEPLLLIDWKGAEKKTSLEKFADSLESLLLYS